MSTELGDGDSRGTDFTHDGSQKDETNRACTHRHPLDPGSSLQGIENVTERCLVGSETGIVSDKVRTMQGKPSHH